MRRLALLLVFATGCGFYFGDGDDDPPPCPGWGAPEPGAALPLRNPQTGECESFGGGYPCDDFCGPCPAALTIALPDWGQCYSQCEQLDEATCLETSGCYAAYDEDASLLDAPSKTSFKGCWATAPSGPIQGGGCWTLDAQECSRHDDCSAYYDVDDSQFSRCAPEPTGVGCEAVDCGPGYTCVQLCADCAPGATDCMSTCAPTCVPDNPNSCAAIDCGPGYSCVEVCDTMEPTASGLIPPGECYPQCVPDGTGDPGSCTGQVLCDALPPACPANTTPGIKNGCWTGYCIPDAACGPNDPGTCGQANCLSLPPACPAGTTPGVKNGCWSGYCIPDHACPAAACETLTTEAACSARGDCTPVYSGDDCTCYPGWCTCEDLTFARCESWGMPVPL